MQGALNATTIIVQKDTLYDTSTQQGTQALSNTVEPLFIIIDTEKNQPKWGLVQGSSIIDSYLSR